MEIKGGNNPRINELVRRLMTEKGRTTPELAGELGVSNDTAYKLLKRSDWRLSEMKAVGRFLGVNLHEFFVVSKPIGGLLPDGQRDSGLKEKELGELKQKVAMLELENGYLKEMVEIAKMKLKH